MRCPPHTISHPATAVSPPCKRGTGPASPYSGVVQYVVHGWPSIPPRAQHTFVRVDFSITVLRRCLCPFLASCGNNCLCWCRHCVSSDFGKALCRMLRASCVADSHGDRNGREEVQWQIRCTARRWWPSPILILRTFTGMFTLWQMRTMRSLDP